MKKSYWIILCSWVLIFPFQLFSQAVEQVWYGEIQMTGVSIPLELHIENAQSGLVKMYSPSQSKQGFAVEKWRWNNEEMTWEIAKLKVKYAGKWVADSSWISGEFTQGGMKIPLKWKLTKSESTSPKIEATRPQTPKPPFDYNTQELTFFSDDNGKKIQLSGTLVTPKGEGPFPCLIMVSGSGPQNRDEEIVGHKPFAVIADDLVKIGWATFRYDDRGVAHSEGVFSSATTFDFAMDANAAWKMISQYPSIDAKKVGLLGHSEGGLVAPIVAAENKSVYCIVSLAGPGVTGGQVILQQIEDIAKAEGESEKEIGEALDKVNAVMTFVQNEKDSTSAAKTIRRYINKIEKKKSKEAREEVFQSYNQSFNNKWMKVFLETDPIPFWQKVQCPTLILNGDKDLQVRFDQNANRIAETLQIGHVPYQKVIMADHNHLFQYTETGKTSEYSKLEETISPETLQTIREWLIKLP
jgi:pimeloyl-ACP methyl ester carboxylesterase